MSHPLRMRLLAMLEERPQSPVKLAGTLEMDLGQVSYHVKRLHEAGLIELVETKRRRGAIEHVYASKHSALFGDEAWRRLDRRSRAQLLFPLLQQMAEYANRAARAGGFDRSDSGFTRWTLKVDEEGWGELADSVKRWIDQAVAIEARAAERAGDSFHAGLVLLLFEALPFSDTPAQAAPDPGGDHADRVGAGLERAGRLGGFVPRRGAAPPRVRRVERRRAPDRARRAARKPRRRAGAPVRRRDRVRLRGTRGSGAGGAEAEPEGLVFRFLSVAVRAASCEVTRVRS